MGEFNATGHYVSDYCATDGDYVKEMEMSLRSSYIENHFGCVTPEGTVSTMVEITMMFILGKGDLRRNSLMEHCRTVEYWIMSLMRGSVPQTDHRWRHARHECRWLRKSYRDVRNDRMERSSIQNRTRNLKGFIAATGTSNYDFES